jgi:hypothetical protein
MRKQDSNVMDEDRTRRSRTTPLSASLPGCGQRSRVNENFPLPSRAFLARQNSRVTRSLILPAVFLAAGEAARCRRASTKKFKRRIS